MLMPLIAAASAGLTLLGSYKQARNAKRLRREAKNMTLDTSEYDALNTSLQRQDINAQAMRDVRSSGVGYDQGQFDQSNAIRGAGRNTYGSLQLEGQQQLGRQSATAYMGRQDELGDQNYQRRLGVAQGLTGARLGLLQQKTGLMGQAAAQSDRMWGGIAELGAAGLGASAEHYMNQTSGTTNSSGSGAYARLSATPQAIGMTSGLPKYDLARQFESPLSVYGNNFNVGRNLINGSNRSGSKSYGK